MDLTGVRAEGSNGAADEKEEQVVAEGEGGTDGDSNGSDGATADGAAEAKEETKVED